MEGFEPGRRRPLRRKVSEEMEPQSIAPVYMLMDDEPDLSPLNDKSASPLSSKKRRGKKKSPEDNPNKVLPLIEVDLHIYELVDTTAGMDNYAMLQFQLDTVRKTMKDHCRRIGQKIVFIHGKGDGVLRKEVRALLAKEYASCDVQDASFLKYGFGATQVIVRQR